MPTRILLVEDHIIVRQSLRMLLENEPDMLVVGEAGNAVDAVTKAAELHPDVVVLDVNLDPGDGISSCHAIVQAHPSVRIVVLSAEVAPDIVTRALQSGVAGYVAKHDACDELMRAIRAVREGNFYLCPSIATGLIRAQKLGPPPEAKTSPSEHERELLGYIADGMRNKEIAAKWGQSVKTVEAARARLMAKLGCTSSAELIRYAVREGIAKP